jgi:hydrogenase expression/formation protein HypE
VGRDAAVIEMGDRYLVAKTDPITFASDEIGWYLVNVNANDIATTGAKPSWLLCTALFPEGATRLDDIESVFRQLSQACMSLGITLCGGHTEVAHGVSHTILIGQMLGEVAPTDLVTPEGTRPGDAIILTKGIAVEGTALIAREMGHKLEGLLPTEVIERAARFLHDPGISVVPDARYAAQVARLHSMHDPTEGGLATALYELALASGLALRIWPGRVRILPETELLCRHFGLNPWGTIASGALIIGCAGPDATPVVTALREHGIWADVIGEAVPGEGVTLLGDDGSEQPMPVFMRDEVARLFE